MPLDTSIHLRSFLPEIVGCEPNLRETLEHALRTEGSLSRATLAYSISRELGVGDSKSQSLAAAVEFYHLASLLLDDLPCMDNADTRRGHPCAHTLFGESPTVLAALALINRAYGMIWGCLAGLEEGVSLEAAALVDECLGLRGILNGQALDLNFQSTDRSSKTIEEIALEKTGSLFRLCLLLPAIVGGASRYEKHHLTQLASLWGSAYQVADDLKDVLVGESSSGKTAQRDETLGRPNMALALGVEDTTEMLSERMRAASASTEALSKSGECAWSGVTAFQKEFLAKVEPLLAEQAVA